MTSRLSTGQMQTGPPNQVYDLVSMLSHALGSGSTTQNYIQHAQ